MLNAYASPDQVGIDSRIGGSNIENNGLVVNHLRIHPDYMLAQAEMIAKVNLVSADTATSAPPRPSTIWVASGQGSRA